MRSVQKKTPRHDECSGRLPKRVRGTDSAQASIIACSPSFPSTLRRLLGRTRVVVVNLWALGIILRRRFLWLFEGFPISLERSGSSGHQWGVGGVFAPLWFKPWLLGARFMMTCWETLLEECAEGDTIIACTLSDEELRELFDASYGSIEGQRFTAWSEKYVYFPLVYEGSEWAGRAPRNPCDESTPHQGRR